MTTTTAAYRAVFFDLDGTLLPMELDEFMNAYFKALGSFVARKGLDPASFSAGLKAGTAAMAENDGARTNAEAYWETFFRHVEGDEAAWRAVLDEFYETEFGDIGNILAYLSIGDRPQEVERLVSALAEIKRRYQTDGSGLLSQEYIDPVVAASPQEAFYAPKKSLPLRETEGMVCSEFVMCYPPGIPILAPGERITKEILNYIEYAKAKGCSMTGPEDPDIERLNVLA